MKVTVKAGSVCVGDTLASHPRHIVTGLSVSWFNVPQQMQVQFASLKFKRVDKYKVKESGYGFR